jgi:uncharacterized protein (DUF1501 family)
MDRRKFLQNAALASTSLLVPRFLQSSAPAASHRSRTGKILIVVQLSGGNDGLNTFIPYQNDIYYRSRPTLAIANKEVLAVSDDLGFHPALAPLRELYDEGLVSIVNNVGYPNPDRSHFRSMDIWQSASGSREYWTTGWLGRYLDSHCPTPYHALELDESLSLAMKGNTHHGLAMSDPRRLARTSDNAYLRHIAGQPHDHAHDNVAYLYKTMIEAQQSADYLLAQSQVTQARADYPASAFGRDLKTVAELITADTDTRIYYTSLTGFDTHANQARRQARLLGEYAHGMRALVRDLQHHRLLDDVLILTFSEFGRRVQQNAGGGTDHGTANNLILIGGRPQRPGFFNGGPQLTDLDGGDLRYAIDFRRVYAEVIDRWLAGNSEGVLGEHFAPLGIL